MTRRLGRLDCASCAPTNAARRPTDDASPPTASTSPTTAGSSSRPGVLRPPRHQRKVRRLRVGRRHGAADLDRARRRRLGPALGQLRRQDAFFFTRDILSRRTTTATRSRSTTRAKRADSCSTPRRSPAPPPTSATAPARPAPGPPNINTFTGAGATGRQGLPGCRTGQEQQQARKAAAQGEACFEASGQARGSKHQQAKKAKQLRRQEGL